MNVLGAGLAGLQRVINACLPFTSPETPLAQDVLHTVVLCTLLWYAPRFLEARLEESQDASTASATDREDRAPEARGSERATEHGDGDPATRDDSAARIAAVEAEEDDDDTEEEDDYEAFAPFEAQAHPPHQPGVADIEEEEDAAGPANAHAGPGAAAATIRAQNVGKKKAASLARKDQRRAYHEFMRSQGEAQRARERAAAEAREAEADVERARRVKLEEAVEAKRRAEREKKREEERTGRETEIQRRKRAVEMVRDGVRSVEGVVDLKVVARQVGGAVDEGWVLGLGRAEGLLGGGWRSVEGEGKEAVVCTANGFAVRVREEDLREASKRLARGDESTRSEDGVVSWDEVSTVLEEVVRARAQGQQRSAREPRDEETLDTGAWKSLEGEGPPERLLALIPESSSQSVTYLTLRGQGGRRYGHTMEDSS